MTSMPASRRARAMILAPRSCPSRPGLATTTRILRAVGLGVAMRAGAEYAIAPALRGLLRSADAHRHDHRRRVDRAQQAVRAAAREALADRPPTARADRDARRATRPTGGHDVVLIVTRPHEADQVVPLDADRLRCEDVVADADPLRGAGRGNGQDAGHDGDGCEDGDEPLHGCC